MQNIDRQFNINTGYKIKGLNFNKYKSKNDAKK